MTAILIYGATGYTGTAPGRARRCAQGLRPILAGRDPEKLRALAARLGLESRAAPLDAPERLRAALAGRRRGDPRGRTLLQDGAADGGGLPGGGRRITSTSPARSTCWKRSRRGMRQAKAAGIVLLPAAGFDVVPSDCLAAHVAARLPGATHLRISIGGFGGFSRGTARTMVEGIAWGTRVRRDGRIVELPSPPRGSADFGRGPRRTVGLGWGDVSSAWYSTRVPNIDGLFRGVSRHGGGRGPAGGPPQDHRRGHRPASDQSRHRPAARRAVRGGAGSGRAAPSWRRPGTAPAAARRAAW